MTTEQLTIALALAAIILSILAMAFEILFYIVQTRAAKEDARERSKFSQEMSALLGKIEGRTNTTLEQLWQQFKSLLDATISRGADEASEDVQGAMQELKARVEAVESKMPSVGAEAARREIATMKEQVSSLAQELREKTRSAIVRSSQEATGEFPAPPVHRFFGRATLDGKPAPDGTPVTATVTMSPGKQIGFSTNIKDGRYFLTLAMPGFWREAMGAEVTFAVGGKLALQKGVWQMGQVTRLDLSTAGAAGK